MAHPGLNPGLPVRQQSPRCLTPSLHFALSWGPGTHQVQSSPFFWLEPECEEMEAGGCKTKIGNPQLIHKTNAISIKIPIEFLVKLVQLMLKFTRKGESVRIAKTILKCTSLTLTNIMIYYNTLIMNTSWLLTQGWTNKSMGQKREPRSRLKLDRILVYDQKALQIWERINYSELEFGEALCRKNIKLDLSHTNTKINLRRINDLIVKKQSYLKSLLKKSGRISLWLGTEKEFLSKL